MGNQLHTRQFVLLGGMLLKKHPTVAQLNGTRMLHTAKLVAGKDHQPIFLEGVGDTRIAFHPFQRLTDLIKHLIELCHLRGISLAVECTDGLTLTAAGLLVEVSGHEGIEVGGQLTSIAARHRLPSCRCPKRGHEDRSEVGLVEAGERGTCQVWYEKGVHIILVAVQSLVETREVDLDLVLSLLQRLHRHDDMLILIGSLYGATFLLLAGINVTDTVVAALEIKHQILPHFQVEPDDGFTCDPVVQIRRDVEG